MSMNTKRCGLQVWVIYSLSLSHSSSGEFNTVNDNTFSMCSLNVSVTMVDSQRPDNRNAMEMLGEEACVFEGQARLKAF